MRQITVIIILLIAAALAGRNAIAAPSPPSPATLPATQPVTHALHVQAYDLMRAGRFDLATPLLNRLLRETPPPQRTRALAMNVAILDLAQKQNPLRGVKELNDYLAQHPTDDEAASNVLGAALNLAADNPKWRAGPIYAAALREFARREASLERSRPGFRRWGAAWVSEEQIDAVKAKQKALQESVDAAYRDLQQRTSDLHVLNDQYNEARQVLLDFRRHNHARMNGGTLVPDCPDCQAAVAAQQAAAKAAGDIRTATDELQRATREYQAMKRQEIRPDWPSRFEPVDPSAPPPAMSPPRPALGLGAAPTDGTTVTTQPSAWVR